jgi:hypothetical protein
MPPVPDQPSDRTGRTADVGPSVEDHGRVVTASRQAAAFYRQAQQAVDSAHAMAALRLAIEADPAFALAVADLDALTAAPPSPIGGRQMGWERHHVEVVRTASGGNLDRAAALLRELLASVGCDPLALRILTDLYERKGRPGPIEDLTGQLPACHRAPRS